MKDRRSDSQKKLFPMWLEKGRSAYNSCLVKWRLKGWILDWDMFWAFGLNLPVFYVTEGASKNPLARYLYGPKRGKFRLTNYTDEEGQWVDTTGGSR